MRYIMLRGVMRYLRGYLLLFVCHFVIAVNDPCGRNDSIDIHIIGFFPCTHPNDTRGIRVDNCDGIERIPIMKLALEEINERCDLLPGYRLIVDYANSACSSVPALYHLIQLTDPLQPTKLMILGPACSGASHLMGEIAERMLNIPQVAYTASDSVFGMDKENYPRFYRMVPITEQIVDGYIAIMKELNWNRVALISYDDDFNIDAADSTWMKLEENNVELIMNESFTDHPDIVLQHVKDINARIIVAWIPHNIAVKFWCTVIKNRLAGPDFVWFLPGWFRANWWAEVDGTDCTAEEMSKALEHTLGGLGNSVVDNDPSRILVSNKSVKQFKEDLEAKNALGTVKTDIFLNVGYVYDAVWTIALALNSSISILEETGERLEEFTYESVEMADVFTEAIANVSFEGISGKISLNYSGNRNQPSVEIHQYRGGEAVPVLVYHPLNNSTKLYEISNQSLKWQDNSVPRDAPVPVVLTSHLVEFIIAVIVASVGILSSIIFFVFNLYYSKHPVVKRSSYRLNSLILVGVFVGFVGTLLHAIRLDSNMSKTFTTTVCNARVWTNELAFVVAFGTLFAKVWRLYKVFFNKKMIQRKYLHDRHLFMMIAVIVAPTLVILIVQVATFPLTLHTITTVNKDDPSTEEVYSECKGQHDTVFSSLSYAENIILALLSVLVAYETQKHVPKFQECTTHNDTTQVPALYKYYESAVINLTTILVILLSSVCKVVLIIFRLNRVQEGVLLVVTLRDCLWMYPILYLLFVPKVYKVYQGMLTDKRMASQYLSMHSNPFYSARASITSMFGRRGSSASVVSERRISYQYGRRSSDVSAGAGKKINLATLMVPERDVKTSVDSGMSYSDITTSQLSRSTKVDSVGNIVEVSSVLYMDLLEEPKSPNIVFRYKTTEV